MLLMKTTYVVGVESISKSAESDFELINKTPLAWFKLDIRAI